MEEFIMRLIERVGFPIAVSLISFWCVFKLFQLRERERSQREDRLVNATIDNTSAVVGLTKKIVEQIGSDPEGKICKYNHMMAELAARGLVLKAEEEAILIKEMARKEAAKVVKVAEETAQHKLIAEGT